MFDFADNNILPTFSSSNWCFVDSQTWKGSDYMRWDPGMCYYAYEGDTPAECLDPDFTTTQMTKDMMDVIQLYEKGLLCSECFLKMWRQQLMSALLPSGEHTNYLLDQYSRIREYCSTQLPVTTYATTLFASTGTVPVIPAPSPASLVDATQDRDCHFDSPFCLPKPCEIDATWGRTTCEELAARDSTDEHHISETQFLSWNQNILGACSWVHNSQRVCKGPPGGFFKASGVIISNSGGVNSPWHHPRLRPAALFYWISGLTSPNIFFETYDQEESLAAFLGSTFEECPMCIHGWGFKPLEVILDSYLDMIDEGKVTLMYPNRPDYPVPMDPWRLLAAIKARQPSGEAADSYNPWSNPDLLTSINLPSNTFTHEFRTGLSTQNIPFRYLAPGIRLLTTTEFATQPYLGSYPTDDPDSLPLLLFCTDEIPAGLYIETIHSKSTRAFSNECYLLLPFTVGGNGWTQTSDGAQAGITIDDEESHPKGDDESLYQSGLNGFNDRRSVQLHKVLIRWA
ncbi:hypothetical protein BDV26DRAFT_296977 [Aspergillus bertholletiae]|uniref:Uncharacterized protein n=1 Tax=Aspergillus bertholletiae TaxID=1226010 RepID=A0A5N7AU36_9EURO|nr:hypothetical protein BDV26DRAFT_296977 [Aspergillus bertholletiae]